MTSIVTARSGWGNPNHRWPTGSLLACRVRSRAFNLADGCRRRFAPADERLVNQEFLKWYRELIALRANSLVCRLNESMDKLCDTLPTFTEPWEKAMKEVEQAMPV